MSIAGSFQVIINSPLGDREATLNLDVTGEVVSGSIHSEDVSQNFSGGAVNGNEVSWEMDLTRPNITYGEMGRFLRMAEGIQGRVLWAMKKARLE